MILFFHFYTTNCISDSFTFADKVKTFNFPPSVFLCSYDLCSLFTNVPLAETIEICADALYNGELTPPPFLRAVFVKLMQTATSSVEFSFNNIMHQQIDGVAMGSPLGPSLANIFVGYYEALLFKRVNKLLMYYRYVDDTFAVFNDNDECNKFFFHLNSLHPSLRFTFETECNRTLPFLDVLVEKNDHEFVTAIYRKPTFTGQYIRWNSFCPMKRKTYLISTLVHRALVICSKSNLQNELSNIRLILTNNGYPEAAINTVITRKINQFRRPTQLGPKKCPVYLHLPWLANVSMRHEMQIKTAVKPVTLQLNYALSTPPENFCLQPKRMYYPLFIKATMFINFCATAIVGTWVVLFKGCNRELSSTCLEPLFSSIFLRTEAHWPALASQSEALKLKLLFLL